jgi:hypothetical protein
VRADESYVVGAGARANEAPLPNFMAQLGALAATSFSNDSAGRERYEALADKARSISRPPIRRRRSKAWSWSLGRPPLP